ncbi:hypothetical protein PTSG_08464 [Salpingoeca rosetta]|uniref:Neurochondrin n=1 Tax=Salpingoeca rosetta (strain ATCC 50818 / BSB-021) TaxID=946362 RepID=F2UJS1_SALR5|nr:uncharacterized protein PTSG_08464 [Salpingoeca rosetta]EGD77370.1 hypothetical protein PTSG_08464 [Salpingoeca rosetta]|eukprot:XP_004990714.1 hypothetical protein PTSG_08464 [Salpingoeca rosetta]
MPLSSSSSSATTTTTTMEGKADWQQPGQGAADPQQQLRTALGVFKNAQTDEQRFVGLLLLAKGTPPSDASDVEAVEKVVGYSFLKRLLNSHGDQNVGLLYPRLAMSILSLYAASDCIARSKSFAHILPNVVNALVRLLETPSEQSGDTDAVPVNPRQPRPRHSGHDGDDDGVENRGDDEDSSGKAANTAAATREEVEEGNGQDEGNGDGEEEEGADIQQPPLSPSDQAVFDALHILITALDYNHKPSLPPQLLPDLNAWLEDRGVDAPQAPMSALLAFAYRIGLLYPSMHATTAVFLAHVFATRHDEYKLESAKALTSLLQSVSPAAFAAAPTPHVILYPSTTSSSSSSKGGSHTRADKKSAGSVGDAGANDDGDDDDDEPCKNWFSSVVRTSKALLQHKLGPRERRLVLQLISAAVAHAHFKHLPTPTLNECLPLICRRAAIEVRMALEQEHLESCIEDVELTACCFFIVEDSISCLVNRGDEMETASLENALSGCKMTVEAVLFFTANSSDNAWESQSERVLLLLAGCARVLGAWFAENDNGIDQFLPTAEYLLQLINDRSLSANPEDRSWSRLVLRHLLPALCTGTAHTPFRHSVVGDTNCISLACTVVSSYLQRAGVIPSEDASSSLSPSSSSSVGVAHAPTKTAQGEQAAKKTRTTGTTAAHGNSDDDSDDGDDSDGDDDGGEQAAFERLSITQPTDSKMGSGDDDEYDASACNLACNLLLNVLVEDPAEARQSASLAQLARTLAPTLAHAKTFEEPTALASLVTAYTVKRDADRCAFALRDDSIRSAAAVLAGTKNTLSNAQRDDTAGESDSHIAAAAVAPLLCNHGELLLLLTMVSGDLVCEVDGNIGKGSTALTYTRKDDGGYACNGGSGCGDGDGDDNDEEDEDDEDDGFEYGEQSARSIQMKRTEAGRKQATARAVAEWCEAVAWLCLSAHTHMSDAKKRKGRQARKQQQQPQPQQHKDGHKGKAAGKKGKAKSSSSNSNSTDRNHGDAGDADACTSDTNSYDEVLEDVKMGALVHFERALSRHRSWLLPRLQRHIGPPAQQLDCIELQAILSM